MENSNLPLQNPENEIITVPEAMAGVFYDPVNTFSSVKSAGKRNYWLIPIIFMIIINMVASFVVMRDVEVMGKILDKQKVKMIESMNQRVKDGKMTQEQANQSIQQAEKFMDPKSPFFMAIGMISGIIMPFMIMILMSVLGLIAIKILKGQFEFYQLLNVTSLSLTIIVVSSVLTTFLTIFTGDLFSFSPAFFFKNSSINAFVEAIIQKIDIFYFWFLAIASLGYSKMGNVKFAPMLIIVFVAYILFSLLTSLPALIF